MISVKPQPLESAKVEAIKRWLRQPEFTLLKQIAEGHLHKMQDQFLQDAMKAAESNQVIDRANAHLRDAQSWQDFLDKLAGITNGTIALETAIVS